MALPQSSDILTMEFNFGGFPFVNLPSKSSINLLTMDYNFLGFPFVSNGFSETSKIKKVHETPWGNIKNIHGKGKGSIKTFGPTSTT